MARCWSWLYIAPVLTWALACPPSFPPEQWNAQAPQCQQQWLLSIRSTAASIAEGCSAAKGSIPAKFSPSFCEVSAAFMIANLLAQSLFEIFFTDTTWAAVTQFDIKAMNHQFGRIMALTLSMEKDLSKNRDVNLEYPESFNIWNKAKHALQHAKQFNQHAVMAMSSIKEICLRTDKNSIEHQVRVREWQRVNDADQHFASIITSEEIMEDCAWGASFMGKACPRRMVEKELKKTEAALTLTAADMREINCIESSLASKDTVRASRCRSMSSLSAIGKAMVVPTYDNIAGALAVESKVLGETIPCVKASSVSSECMVLEQRSVYLLHFTMSRFFVCMNAQHALPTIDCTLETTLVLTNYQKDAHTNCSFFFSAFKWKRLLSLNRDCFPADVPQSIWFHTVYPNGTQSAWCSGFSCCLTTWYGGPCVPSGSTELLSFPTYLAARVPRSREVQLMSSRAQKAPSGSSQRLETVAHGLRLFGTRVDKARKALQDRAKAPDMWFLSSQQAVVTILGAYLLLGAVGQALSRKWGRRMLLPVAWVSSLLRLASRAACSVLTRARFVRGRAEPHAPGTEPMLPDPERGDASEDLEWSYDVGVLAGFLGGVSFCAASFALWYSLHFAPSSDLTVSMVASQLEDYAGQATTAVQVLAACSGEVLCPKPIVVENEGDLAKTFLNVLAFFVNSSALGDVA